MFFSIYSTLTLLFHNTFVRGSTCSSIKSIEKTLGNPVTRRVRQKQQADSDSIEALLALVRHRF